MAKIMRKKSGAPFIPTASMSDISFLLLLFFMVTTVFVKAKGLKITKPLAKSIKKIPRDHSATIYLNTQQKISIDDFIVSIPQVQNLLMMKKAKDFNLIVCFRTDKDASYGYMADILKQCQYADALRVNFEAKLER